MSLTGTVVLGVTVVVALLGGLLVRNRSGRVRVAGSTADGAGPLPNGWDLTGAPPTGDERVLLLQLSSPVCAPCRQTAAVLGELAATDPALRHVEIDVADRTEVARTLGVLRTPTTVAFDRDGREVLRVSGVPRPAELADVLAHPHG